MGSSGAIRIIHLGKRLTSTERQDPDLLGGRLAQIQIERARVLDGSFLHANHDDENESRSTHCMVSPHKKAAYAKRSTSAGSPAKSDDGL